LIANRHILKTKIISIYIVVMFLFSVASCKKFVEDQKQQAAMSFITNGHWKVQSMLIDTVSITSEFEGYKFKFNDDGTVDGITASQTLSGTWVGDVSDYSITSDFAPAGDPLQELNGRWLIKDSGTDYVKADLTIYGSVKHLHLVNIP
jgi:hypothetical protein